MFVVSVLYCCYILFIMVILHAVIMFTYTTMMRQEIKV